MKKNNSILFFWLWIFQSSISSGEGPPETNELREIIKDRTSAGYSFDAGQRYFKVSPILLGYGNFAVVHQGTLTEMNKVIDVAFKFEIENVSIQNELKVYEKFNKHLHQHNATDNLKLKCVAEIYGSFKENINGFNVIILVMKLLGKSLFDIQKMLVGPFTMTTILMLGIQLLKCIYIFHAAGIKLADIKPENMLIGLGDDRNHVFFTDIGGSKAQEGSTITCTIKYASLQVLEWMKDGTGYQLAEDDDIYSITASLVELFRGNLEEYAPTLREFHSMTDRQRIQSVIEVKKKKPLSTFLEKDTNKILKEFVEMALFRDNSGWQHKNMALGKQLNLKLELFTKKENRIFDWAKSQPAYTLDFTPIVRTKESIAEYLPEKFRGLYNMVASKKGALVAERYEVLGLINWGSNSLVFLAQDRTTNKYFALKMQNKRWFGLGKNKLTKEFERFEDFETLNRPKYLANIFGNLENIGWIINVLVMELLGPSLKALKDTFGFFPLKTIYQIMRQMSKFTAMQSTQRRLIFNPSQILTRYDGTDFKIINYNYYVKPDKPIKLEHHVSLNSLLFAADDYLRAVNAGRKITPTERGAEQSLYYSFLYLIDHKKREEWKVYGPKPNGVASNILKGRPKLIQKVVQNYANDNAIKEYLSDGTQWSDKLEEPSEAHQIKLDESYFWAGRFDEIPGYELYDTKKTLSSIDWKKK